MKLSVLILSLLVLSLGVACSATKDPQLAEAVRRWSKDMSFKPTDPDSVMLRNFEVQTYAKKADLESDRISFDIFRLLEANFLVGLGEKGTDYHQHEADIILSKLRGREQETWVQWVARFLYIENRVAEGDGETALSSLDASLEYFTIEKLESMRDEKLTLLQEKRILALPKSEVDLQEHMTIQRARALILLNRWAEAKTLVDALKVSKAKEDLERAMTANSPAP